MSDLTKILVQEQFPEFYQEEYPVFVEFLKQYYSYLSTTSSGKVESYKDIDASVDSFIINLKNDFAKNVPQFNNLSDRDFLIFAKEFYSARGSEDSYKFLFRAMYGKEVDIFYPSTLIFKASDGRWQQDVVIRVQLITGDASSFSDKTANIIDSLGRKLPLYVQKVKSLGDNIWEFYIDRLFTGAITSGDVVEFGINSGEVLNGASSLSVVSGGSGYDIGDYFDVVVSGQTLRFRVSKINLDTSIHKVEIITSGSNFTTDVYAKIYPGNRGSDTNDQTVSGNYALIKISPGSVLKYPGFFATANGFASDVIRMQDNEYYQAFSYVIKLDEKLDSYSDIVKRLLHPSGMALWGQYDVTVDLSIGVSMEDTVRSLIVTMQEEVFATEVFSKLFSKIIYENVINTDLFTVDIDKLLLDNTVVSETGSLQKQPKQNYAVDDYFLEIGSNKYSHGDTGIENRNW